MNKRSKKFAIFTFSQILCKYNSYCKSWSYWRQNLNLVFKTSPNVCFIKTINKLLRCNYACISKGRVLHDEPRDVFFFLSKSPTYFCSPTYCFSQFQLVSQETFSPQSISIECSCSTKSSLSPSLFV